MPSYEPEAGPRWADRARLPGLASVLDPADLLGAKNRLIDGVQRTALNRSLGSVSGLRVVDFGCGTGRASAWLAAQGATVHGVDTSPEMINVATRLVPEAQFAVLEEADLPFESNSVDVVMSISVLQYVPQELGKLTEILREWRRVLRPEGLAIAVEQVNNGNLGRAAPSSHYVDSFAEAGLTTIMFKPIRLGHSRFVQLAERHPRVAGLPILPRLIIREAGSSRLDLSGSRYADFLFIARPVTRP